MRHTRLHLYIPKWHTKNQEQRNILTDYAKSNNLYISDGSDYHWSSKPDIEIGVGRGDLSIYKEISNWLYE